jgi:hypothetical protein
VTPYVSLGGGQGNKPCSAMGMLHAFKKFYAKAISPNWQTVIIGILNSPIKEKKKQISEEKNTEIKTQLFEILQQIHVITKVT